jgi:signal transduction histidine kinase
VSVHGTKLIGRSGWLRSPIDRGAADSAQNGAVERPAPASATDFPLAITAMPIDATQRRVALGVMIAVLLIDLASAPFAHQPVGHIDSFLPVLQGVLCILHLITAVWLFSQYSIWPRFATLAIASGYVFSGLLAFEQTFAFPGAYSAKALIGDGLNTSAWLFIVWHTVFPLTAIVYALTKDAKDVLPPARSPLLSIFVAVACVVAAAALLTWLLLVSSAHLPRILMTSTKSTVTGTYLDIYLWLLNSTALALLFLRRRTILDLWLIVTFFAWWPMFLVPMYFTVARFSIGWYVAHCLAVLASSALLAVLMGEIILLYARLASSIGLLRRERAERLTSVEAATSAMAHEVRQPLSGIAHMGAAGLNWLKAAPANIERVTECLTGMIDASHRADEIITGIGGLFRRAPGERTMVQLNDVCREVMRLVQHDILAYGISVRIRCKDDLPLTRADHTQLQQVILNLVRNAIDAMSSRPAGERRLRLWTSFDGKSGISLCVRDSGPGISDDDRKHIFEPFYTTKANGMGLGLAICRKIIEEHGGTLRLVETNAHGSMFETVLPVGGSLSVSAAASLNAEAPLQRSAEARAQPRDDK